MGFVREPNAEPLPGYRLIEPLGSGGFGEAWKCEAPGGLFKAIKFVFGNLNSMDLDGARAEQEFKALNRVKEVRHPFVLSLDRIEIVGGELVIVMELADKSLHDAYEEALATGLVGIPHDALLRYVRDAAEALDHMNDKHGLQHLDVKPRNLFLVSDRVKVADFGLVKHLERSGASGVMGAVTPLYAPPETFSGEISGSSDQYSLAIVYQELLTGHRPFNGKNARQLANQHMNEAPDLRALPEAERPVVARALEKDPNKRYPNCLAFVKALYTARTPTMAQIVMPTGPTPQGTGGRPKSISDTLENFQFDGPSADQLIPVDLGDSVPKLSEDGEAVSRLGVTVAQPTTGALRPTLIVGLGGDGRRAMMELRCRLIDRFGDLDKVPLLRFLYVDVDGDAIKASQRGSAEVAFRAHEVYHLPLRPVSDYRRRQIDQLADWLPREKLYAMPRSLKTQGTRALGRLAFTDNYVRLAARLKREIQQACDPDVLVQSVQHTGLALRDNVPRAYVVGGACGGASGFLADLGYTLRRLLGQLQQPESPVVGMVLCGAPDDPATPPAEQANLYATLTELNHYSDQAITFSAQYGTDGPRLMADGQGFDQVYLLTQPHRSPEGRRDTLSHLGNYLFHELTTPLGLRLDHSRTRHNHQRGPFRALGTFSVWFPRGLLLRMAARDACLRLMDDWQSGGAGALTPSEQSLLQGAQARVLADPELQPGTLANRIEQLVGEHAEFAPREALTRLLVQVEEQSRQAIAQEDPGAWARQTLQRVREWLGSGVSMPGVTVMQQRKSALTKALESATAALAKEWDHRLGEVLKELMDQGGRRVALAEAAVARFIHFCDESLGAQQQKLHRACGSGASQEQLEQAVQNCVTGAGGWSLFGGGTRRLLRVFVDHLTAFARQCLTEDVAASVMQFYAALRGRLGDRMRDLGFCRQRLRHVHELLTSSVDVEDEPEAPSETMTFTRTSNGGLAWAPAAGLQANQTPMSGTQTFWQSIRESSNNRVVLPPGDKELEQSARRFVGTLKAEHWAQLDQVIGELVLAPRGGLLRVCMGGDDLVRHFVSPLLIQATTCLSGQLPITDVAQVESADGEGLADRILSYHALAAPALPKEAGRPKVGSGVGRTVMVGPSGAEVGGWEPRGGATRQQPARLEQSFLLIPASEAGKAFGEEAKAAVAEVHLVSVPGQADLTFCRELASLSGEELERLLMPCRNAYHEHCLSVQTSPHARFDVSDWTPLDP